MSEPEPTQTSLLLNEIGEVDATTGAVETPREQKFGVPGWIKNLWGWFLIFWHPTKEAFLRAFSFLFRRRPDSKAILLWLFCGLLLIPHAFLVYRWPHGDYGIGVLNDHFYCGSHGEAFMIFLIQLPINAMATGIVYAAGYIRVKAWFPLKVVLFLLSIPGPQLYNSIFFNSAPARDSYELLVSYDFLHGGKPFDLAAVPLRQTNSRANALSQDYNMTLPGLGNLTDSVTQVQKSAILGRPLPGWNNMTIKKCLERYQSGTYNQFSNVIIVSNWTAPQNENNSVLDLTILSGYAGPNHQTWQALASLCPDSFFEVNNLTEPKTWKNIAGTAPDGACDPYVPKKWKIKKKNVFIKYCLSEEPKEVCRLLYSPLALKLCFWLLVATVATMTLALLLGLCGVKDEFEDKPHSEKILLGFAVVSLSFIIMLFVTAYSGAAHRHPASKSDQTWILRAFCVINVVQLIDAICDAIIIPWDTATWYPVLSLFWHWFLSGTFSMELSDRYLITNTPPGFEIVPYSDLSSLWFKWLFVTMMIDFMSFDILAIVIVLVLFALPFVGRLYLQLAILGEDFDGRD